MIRITCANCQRAIQVPPEIAGRRIYCPSCRRVIAVPAEPVPPQEQATLPPAAEVNSPATITAPPTPPAANGSADIDAVSNGPVAAQHNSPAGYEILEELGRGGMGVVYKARQTKLQRIVALKMILGGSHASAGDLERFRTEAESIARLQHPHIVQIYEIGEWRAESAGPPIPWFSLEFCGGGSLAQRLGGTPLPAPAAATLVETLARAMQAAHDKGIIHRDLKPANILLQGDQTGENGAGDLSSKSEGSSLQSAIPKITDFGLAKKLDEASQTQSGVIMGTPSSMAPEQADGKSRTIGPAADVYALGAILYECLTGRPPFRAATALDTVLQVVSEDPVPPAQLNARVPRDLETICLKCLHKAPDKRFAQAVDLADDLRRFLAGEPIRARPIGAWERAAKWARRRPAVAALAAALVLLLVVLAAALAGTALALERSLLAENAEAEQRGKATTETARALAALDRARLNIMTAQLLRVSAVCDQNPWLGRELLEDAAACPPGLRDFSWGYYRGLCRRDDRVVATPAKTIRTMALSPNGKFFALVLNDEVQLREAANGNPIWANRVDDFIYTVAFDPESKILAVPRSVRKSKTFSVQLWDVATGKEVMQLAEHAGPTNSLAFNPDGRTLAVCSTVEGGKGLKLWTLPEGKEERSLPLTVDRVAAVAFSPDGQTLAAACSEVSKQPGALLRLWDRKTGMERTLFVGPNVSSSAMTFSPDGRLLAVGVPFAIKLVDPEKLQIVASLDGHPEQIASLSFRADGQMLAAASGATIKLWDVAGRKLVANLDRHGSVAGGRGFVRQATFNAEGDLLTATYFASALSLKFQSAEVRLWDTHPRPVVLQRRIDTQQPVPLPVSLSSDGAMLVTTNPVALWNVADGKNLRTVWGTQKELNLRPAQLNMTGRTIEGVSVDASGINVVSLDVATGEVHGMRTFAHQAFPGGTFANLGTGGSQFLLSRDARALAVGCQQPPAVRVADVARGDVRTLPDLQQAVTALAFREDGLVLACGCQDGSAILWEVASGTQVAVLGRHATPVHAVAVSPDGKLAATGSYDGTLKVWDVASGKELATAKVHTAVISSLAFSPDGKSLVSSSWDSTLILWEPVTCQQRATLTGHEGWVYSVAFSPDGRTLASTGADRCVRLWQAEFPK